jgi:hypothetical protein
MLDLRRALESVQGNKVDDGSSTNSPSYIVLHELQAEDAQIGRVLNGRAAKVGIIVQFIYNNPTHVNYGVFSLDSSQCSGDLCRRLQFG